jgi:hypothetical protein
MERTSESKYMIHLKVRNMIATRDTGAQERKFSIIGHSKQKQANSVQDVQSSSAISEEAQTDCITITNNIID